MPGGSRGPAIARSDSEAQLPANCPICGERPHELLLTDTYAHIDCPACGLYRIDRPFLAFMQGNPIEPVRARLRLEERRAIFRIPLLCGFDDDLRAD